MTRTVLILVLACLVPSSALARRAQTHSAEDDALVGDVGPQGELATSSGASPRLRVPPVPPAPPDVTDALSRARPEIARCLETAGFVGSVRINARIERGGALTVTVTPRPADAGVRDCAELAAQRQLANVAAGRVTRTIRGSITVRRRPAAAPVPRPPHPRTPTTAADDAIAGSVHARLDQDRGGLLQCLSSAAPGVLGTATLRVTLQPDGTLLLSSASLPTGLPAGPALPCLSSRIGMLRFAPAPARPLAIDHTIELGL